MAKKNKRWPSPPIPPTLPGHPPITPPIGPIGGDRQWVTVAVDDGPVYTQRLRVAGGWLYRCMGIWLGHSGNIMAMCFVPLLEEPPDGGWGSI